MLVSFFFFRFGYQWVKTSEMARVRSNDLAGWWFSVLLCPTQRMAKKLRSFVVVMVGRGLTEKAALATEGKD